MHLLANIQLQERVRLQYQNYDYAADADADRQVFLQYIYSLGAHKAHSF